MAKDIEVSVLNETTILVKDVTVDERFKNRHFGEIRSDVIYVDDMDETKTLQFATSFSSIYSSWTSTGIATYTQIYVLPSKSLQSPANVKITSVYNDDSRRLVGNYKMNSDRVGSSYFWLYSSRGVYARHDKCVVYQVEFMNGIKFDIKRTLNINPERTLKCIYVLEEMASNQEIYKSGFGLNFTFVIDGKVIKASKSVLASNSYVFKAMLTNDSKESREVRVDISDVEFDVMDTFIRALHGVKMRIKDITMALQLMVVADKCKVKPLQLLAENYVKNGIRGESVIDALVVSHQLGLTDVQEKCLQHIINWSKPIDELTGFDKVPQEVAVLISRSFVKRKWKL